jgi:protein transport protein SEC61 subunit gamma-like protein
MKFKKFIEQCKRVLKVTKKPNRKEFTTVAKISGLGILIIGLLGFAVFTVVRLLFI